MYSYVHVIDMLCCMYDKCTLDHMYGSYNKLYVRHMQTICTYV